MDEEAKAIFEKLQESPHREQFILHKHAAIRPADIQRLLMMYRPDVVHFSGHASKKQKIILGGVPGRGKQINRQALVDVFALYREHVRLVFLNACFTRTQARSLAKVIDYSIGSRKPLGDKEAVTLAGAFYRALGFGKSIKEAFDSATVELALENMTRAQGVELFVRDGLAENDRFPRSFFNLDDQLAPSPPARLASSTLEHDQYRNRKSDWAVDRLPRHSMVAGVAMRRGQINASGEYPDQRNHLCEAPETFAFPAAVLIPNFGGERQSSKRTTRNKVRSDTFVVTRSWTTVTVEQSMVTLTRSRAACQRMPEGGCLRGDVANERRNRSRRGRRRSG